MKFETVFKSLGEFLKPTVLNSQYAVSDIAFYIDQSITTEECRFCEVGMGWPVPTGEICDACEDVGYMDVVSQVDSSIVMVTVKGIELSPTETKYNVTGVFEKYQALVPSGDLYSHREDAAQALSKLCKN